ncbi:hypothetical protein ADL03_15980 [Nocardia sp. NRRL S-836]|nr:hypothetical protein ADL03_15980 [Nocardia sp. NRRL S-836]
MADILARTSLELTGDDATELAACLVAAYNAGQRAPTPAPEDGKPYVKVTATEDDFVTLALPDGRVLDVFPSGNVQVYTRNRCHALEITLPDSDSDSDAVVEFDGRIKVIRLA